MSANSPGSPPGSENRDLGPGGRGGGPREGRAVRTPTWGGDLVGPATLGGQPAAVEAGTGTPRSCTRACARGCPGSTCLPWSLPSITASSRGSPDAGDRVRDTKALGEVASSFEYPLGQPPCCLDGDHYCFRGTGKGRELQPGSGTPKGLTLFTPQGLRRGPGPRKAALNVPLLSPHRRGAGGGVRPSPAPPHPLLVLGPHLRQPGGPKGRVGSSLCPSCLPAGVQTQSRDKKILW